MLGYGTFHICDNYEWMNLLLVFKKRLIKRLISALGMLE